MVTSATLTPNNAEITVAGKSCITLPNVPVELVLADENSLAVTSGQSAGITASNQLTISGAGDLSVVNNAFGYGISVAPMKVLTGVDRHLLLKGTGTITLKAFAGLYTQYGKIKIDAGMIKAENGTHGIMRFQGDLEITGGDVTASGSSFGIYATTNNGMITISGGKVQASRQSRGIYAVNDTKRKSL